jgi:MFS transporter, DHA1 family, multidrug resistance protein
MKPAMTISKAIPQQPKLSAGVVSALLICFLSLQPLSTDLYLPSLPTITKILGAEGARIQLTLSLFLAGFAISQLIVGPITDKFGRLPGIFGGLTLYAAGSALCALATDVDALIAGRVIQGLAVGAVVVSGRAVFRDSFEPEEGAKKLARVYGLIGFVPFFAPIVGSLLLMYIGWQAGFWFLTLIGLGMIVFSTLKLVETNRFKNPKALDLKPIFANYWMVFLNGKFQSFTSSAGASFSGLFCFLSASSFVLINLMKLTPFEYSIGFSSVTVGYMLGTYLAKRQLPKLGIVGTARRATLFHLTGGYSMLALALLTTKIPALLHPLAILVPIFIYLVGHGMLQPCCQTGAVAPFPKNAGAASALLGFLMNVMAAAISFLLASAFDGSTLPMAVGIAACATLAAIFAHRFIK